MQDVLLLNCDEQPLRTIPFERAVWLLLTDKVRLVKQWGDKLVRAASTAVPWPSIVALKSYVRNNGRIRYKRRNILLRDDYTCQYCGLKPTTKNGMPNTRLLTLDHVVPRSRAVRGKVTLPWSGETVNVSGWENVVTACGPCNHKKADRTPSEASMALSRRPKHPNAWKGLGIVLRRRGMPKEWKVYKTDLA